MPKNSFSLLYQFSSGSIRLNILKILYDKYGLTEKNLLSAEFEVVPAIKARDVGLDRSMVGGYGQDDRVCAYAAFEAILKEPNPRKTTVCILIDKEEIGNVGNTGARSSFFEGFICEVLDRTSGYSGLKVNRTLRSSRMLSADVTAALDPNYENVMDRLNSAYIGGGVCICKYTGHRGKSSANDAHSEYLNEVIQMLNANKIVWQICEMGKVDAGGGGTVAGDFANLGINVLDIGVPLLSMHSPFEVASKIDIYLTYLAYKIFFRS